MKSKYFKIAVQAVWILPFLAILAIGSCKKYNYLGYTPGNGAPTITSVHTYYKTDTTPMYDTVVTYNAAGQPTYTYDQLGQQPYGFDSVTTAGALGNYYLIEGTNLGSATLVTFNGYTAYFNRAYSTDNSILVQIPSLTPYYGPQANDTLVVTTTHGVAYYKFTILPPPPTVSNYSDFDFTATGGFQMTLTGVGFATVSSINLDGTLGGQAAVNIVSQNDTVMVVSFPNTPVTRGFLSFSYNSGGTTDSALGTQELVNVDAAYQIFAYGAIASEWGSWSWDNTQVSTAFAMTASSSYNMQFSGGGWKIDGFREGGGTATDGLDYSASYTYLVFWVYGGVAKETLYIEWGNEGFNNSSANEINAETVLPGQWNYFKIPIPTLLWNTGTTNWAANNSQLLNTCAFFMNSNSVTEQLYFDDLILVQ
jgi:IPT/TIG domain